MPNQNSKKITGITYRCCLSALYACDYSFLLDQRILHYTKKGSSLTLYDGGTYRIETSPLICIVNQLTGFYMIGASAMKR